MITPSPEVCVPVGECVHLQAPANLGTLAPRRLAAAEPRAPSPDGRGITCNFEHLTAGADPSFLKPLTVQCASQGLLEGPVFRAPAWQ